MNRVVIKAQECKGCRLCMEHCPKKCIAMSSSINKMGYQYAEFNSEACIACGTCFFVCPEAGTITVITDNETPSNG